MLYAVEYLVTEEPDARVGARMTSSKKFVSAALGSVKNFSFRAHAKQPAIQLSSDHQGIK
jgi:hypothetical protein